jgi:hypothetical protein
VSDPALLKKFDQAMFDVYRRAKSEAKYNASVFLNMLTKDGGWLTAKSLINASRQSDGFTALHLAGRLDLTVEAVVTENAIWHPLFTEEEIEKARHRLVQNKYVPKEAMRKEGSQ